MLHGIISISISIVNNAILIVSNFIISVVSIIIVIDISSLLVFVSAAIGIVKYHKAFPHYRTRSEKKKKEELLHPTSCYTMCTCLFVC